MARAYGLNYTFPIGSNGTGGSFMAHAFGLNYERMSDADGTGGGFVGGPITLIKKRTTFCQS